jgi:hypothetical protein
MRQMRAFRSRFDARLANLKDQPRHLFVLTPIWEGHKAVGPLVFVQRVRVDDEAVRLVLKTSEFTGSVDAVFGGFGRAVNPDNLEVVVLLIEVQLTLSIPMLDGGTVEVASMTNVLKKVHVHENNLAQAETRRRSSAPLAALRHALRRAQAAGIAGPLSHGANRR